MNNPIWECLDECFKPAPQKYRKTWTTGNTFAMTVRRWMEYKGYSEKEVKDWSDRVIQGTNYLYWAGERGLSRAVHTSKRHNKTKCPIWTTIHPIELKPEWEKKLQLVGINKFHVKPTELPLDWGRK